jgi:hypothetical protein
MRRFAACVALLAGYLSVVPSAQKAPLPDLDQTLAGVAEYLQDYFARAQSIICDETVRVQALGSDLLSLDSMPRVVRNELRISWEPAEGGGITTPQVLRELISVNGRPPRIKDRERDADRCFDQHAISPEILGSLFLPENRADYTYKVTGLGKSGGRPAVLVDVLDVATGPVELHVDGVCSSFGKPGTLKWRAWIDVDDYAVLRLDQSLNKQYEVTIPANRKLGVQRRLLTVQRSDETMVFKRVEFKDPDDTIMLPATRESVQVLQNSFSPRMRTSFTYKNYRRFMTNGRIVQ